MSFPELYLKVFSSSVTVLSTVIFLLFSQRYLNEPHSLPKGDIPVDWTKLPLQLPHTGPRSSKLRCCA